MFQFHRIVFDTQWKIFTAFRYSRWHFSLSPNNNFTFCLRERTKLSITNSFFLRSKNLNDFFLFSDIWIHLHEWFLFLFFCEDEKFIKSSIKLVRIQFDTRNYKKKVQADKQFFCMYTYRGDDLCLKCKKDTRESYRIIVFNRICWIGVL